MKVVVVIPAYNEEKYIRDIIISCQKKGYSDIIVVNDGSTDRTAELARGAGASVVSHMINRGAGAATQTGLHAAKQLGAEIAVTIDADGQHQAKDIKKLVDALMSHNKDVVIGSRFLNKDNTIPFLRKIFNTIANLITFSLTGILLTDTQSGLKAFSKKALLQVHITADGYEFSSEIIREAKHYQLQIEEVPVSVIYTPDSLSKGQNLSTGITTVFKLMIRTLMR